MSEPNEETETETAPQEAEEVEEIEDAPVIEDGPSKAEKADKKDKESAFQYYKIEAGKLTRLRPFCERCGPGYFMANHGDRYTCGNCGFTRYMQKS
ncbi:MAG: 30S ribosomal protein S27ae [Candidatus Bathyarchaeota archaeon]|nr:MAG: 30S ribosomal protein S27ae [Candidatus Bathyarchaeota archaeon]